MFGEEVIKQLKQTNVSMVSEKTMQRVGELYKASSKENKEAIEKMANATRPSVQRVYKTGSISAKLIVSMAQVFDVNPLYLTGESDEKTACTDDLLSEFLISKGYESVLSKTTKKKVPKKTVAKQNNRSNHDASAEQPEPLVAALTEVKKVDEPEKVKDFINTLTEEQMITLMRSILLRAESGYPSSVELAYNVKKLLVTETL